MRGPKGVRLIVAEQQSADHLRDPRAPMGNPMGAVCQIKPCLSHFCISRNLI
jgi:hypothetical protein